MRKSVAHLFDGAETFTLKDWKDFAQRALSDQHVWQQRIRDPLKGQSFGVDVVAVFGFHDNEDTRASQLVYFWHEELGALNWSKLLDDSNLALCIAFGCELGRLHERPHLKDVMGVLSRESLAFAKTLSGDAELFWMHFAQIRMVCLYRAELVGDIDRPSVVPALKLVDCLSFHYDYLQYRSPIWNAVPMRYLFNTAGGATSAIMEAHLSPKCFNPMVPTKPSAFLWPWQACIQQRDTELRLVPMPTISLAFDLRRSTLAMEELLDISEFSPFIEGMIATAKEVIFKHGGFFDKDTGDGLVAHFVDFSLFANAKEFPLYASASVRSFEAAREIVRLVSLKCDALQPKLRHGISSLGPAVGIHAGDAVWISDRNGVRAIGDSVVYAVRLCGNADPRSIFVTNAFFSKLAAVVKPEVSASFRKRQYVGKEYGGRAELFGFAVTQPDSL